MPLLNPKFSYVAPKSDTERQIIIGDWNKLLESISASHCIYIDGAGWNGSKSKICIATAIDEALIIEHYSEYTNNEEEYKALILALNTMKGRIKSNMPIPVIFTDSELMYNQMIGKYKTKNLRLQMLKFGIEELLAKTNTPIDLQWIPREQNIAGIILEKHK